MKKILPALFIFCISYNYAFSQQDTVNNKVNFIVKTDILYSAIGLGLIISHTGNLATASLTFETCFKEKHSLQLTALFGYYDTGKNRKGFFPTIRQQDKAYQIIPEYKRFFHAEKNYAGSYYGAYLKFTNYTWRYEYFNDAGAQNETNHAEWNMIGGGLILGYQNYIHKRLLFDFISGLGYNHQIKNTIYEASETSSIFSSMLDLRFAFNIGYRF